MAVDLITQSIGIYQAGENMQQNQFHAVRMNEFERWQLTGVTGLQGIVNNAPRSGEVANVIVFGVAKAKLAGIVVAGRQLASDVNSQFVEGAGPVIAMENGVAGDIISAFISVSKSDVGTFPWHILEKEQFVIPDRRQAIIHGLLDIEGDLILEGSAQLMLEI